MSRLYPILYFTLLMILMQVEAAGQFGGKLAKLTEVNILVETLGREAKELGLNEDDIIYQVFVYLRSKLSRLKVSKSADSTVYINVNINKSHLESGEVIGYYGSLRVEIWRPVTINKTGKIVSSTIWLKSFAMRGIPATAVSEVREQLELLLTKFAADWYRDNP